MAELRWHCFEDSAKNALYCIQYQYGKETAAESILNKFGFAYDQRKHIYSCWNSIQYLCQKYNIDQQIWLDADLQRIKDGRENAFFLSSLGSDAMIVYFVPATDIKETYGATCSGCSETFPHAVSEPNFKCWKCSHGY